MISSPLCADLLEGEESKRSDKRRAPHSLTPPRKKMGGRLSRELTGRAYLAIYDLRVLRAIARYICTAGNSSA